MTDEDKPTDPFITAVRRHPAFKLLVVVLPAIVGSLASYLGASDDVKVEATRVEKRAEVIEDKAESGYRVARGALEDLREDVRELRAELAALKRAVRAGSKKVPPAAKAPPVPPASTQAPAPLPATLDKALEQQQGPAEPAKP